MSAGPGNIYENPELCGEVLAAARGVLDGTFYEPSEHVYVDFRLMQRELSDACAPWFEVIN